MRFRPTLYISALYYSNKHSREHDTGYDVVEIYNLTPMVMDHYIPPLSRFIAIYSHVPILILLLVSFLNSFSSFFFLSPCSNTITEAPQIEQHDIDSVHRFIFNPTTRVISYLFYSIHF